MVNFSISKIQLALVNWRLCISNGILHLLAKLLWPQSRPQKAKRVCIYRIGNVGDTVCSLPAMMAIHRAYPEAEFTLLTSPGKAGVPGAQELLKGADWLEELTAYTDNDVSSPAKQLQLIRRLRKKRFDIWIELPNDMASLGSSIRNMGLARLAGAGWGAGWRINTILWAARAQSGQVQFPSEVDRLLKVVSELGIPVSEPDFSLPIQPTHQKRVDRLLEQHQLHNQPWVAIAPGCKRSTNHWPAEHFAEVGRAIGQRKLHTLLIGGQSDAQLCREIAEGIGPKAINLGGATSLLEAAELLKRGRLLICVDSGLQHLAAAVGTPSISIFSFWQMYGKWRPHGEGHTVLQKWVDCHTCYLETCPYENHCIGLVTPDDVKKALDKELG